MTGPRGDGGLADYLELDHEFYVNCTGMRAHALLQAAATDPRLTDAPAAGFEPLADPYPPKLIRGHYLRVGIKEVPVGHRGRCFSYNYMPSAGIYQTAAGVAADLYCYPRSDAWILGGSRQEGGIDDTGAWVGERTVGPETEFPRAGAPPLAVPSAILDLNADILLRMTDGRLDLVRLAREDPTIVAPGIGYRSVRDPRPTVCVSRARRRNSGAASNMFCTIMDTAAPDSRCRGDARSI